MDTSNLISSLKGGWLWGPGIGSALNEVPSVSSGSVAGDRAQVPDSQPCTLTLDHTGQSLMSPNNFYTYTCLSLYLVVSPESYKHRSKM